MLDTQDMRYTRVLVATQMLSPCPGYSSKKPMNYQINSLKNVFSSVVVVAFQIAFRAEIYVNDVFLFFKNYF